MEAAWAPGIRDTRWHLHKEPTRRVCGWVSAQVHGQVIQCSAVSTVLAMAKAAKSFWRMLGLPHLQKPFPLRFSAFTPILLFLFSHRVFQGQAKSKVLMLKNKQTNGRNANRRWGGRGRGCKKKKFGGKLDLSALQHSQNKPHPCPPLLCSSLLSRAMPSSWKLSGCLDFMQGCARDSLLLPWVGCKEFLFSLLAFLRH